MSAAPATADGWDYPDVFIHRVTVVPDDIDRMGHVNNVRYLGMLEECAWAHSAHLDMGWSVYEKLATGVVAHRTEIDYLQAARLGDELEIGTWCTANDGRLRLRRHYQIRRPADDTTLVRAITYWISVDLHTGRPKRMPEAFRKAYRPVAGAPD